MRSPLTSCLIALSVLVSGCGATRSQPNAGAVSNTDPTKEVSAPAPKQEQTQPNASAAPPSQETDSGTSAAAPLGEEDWVLHGIRLGMSANEARQLLRNPVLRDSEDGTYWLEGSGKTAVFVDFKNEVVWRVTVKVGATPRGLQIGDPVQRIVDLYGQPTEKWRDYLIYTNADGLRLAVGFHEDKVTIIHIISSVADLPPDEGREVEPGKIVVPFGPADYEISGIKACSSLLEVAEDPRLKLLTARLSEPGLISTDGWLGVVAYDIMSQRADHIEVTGGTYETARGVRVGDPISRVHALYGPSDKNFYRDAVVLLAFDVNSKGRVESMSLSCKAPKGK